MPVYSVTRRARARTVKSVAERYREGNAAAARIVLADSKYDGLMREVAERTLAAEQAERRREVFLADEGGDHLELFHRIEGGRQ